jgi:hypothetical protein
VPWNPSRIAPFKIPYRAAEHHTSRSRRNRPKPRPDHWSAAQRLLVSCLFADCRLERRLDSLAADLLLEMLLKGLECTHAGGTRCQK